MRPGDANETTLRGQKREPMTIVHEHSGSAISHRLAGVLTALFLITGCRTIPDLKPFSDGTSEVDLVIREIQKFVISDFDTLIAASDAFPVPKKALTDARDGFVAEWKIRVQTTEAMLAYSASLMSVAEAGLQGKESAQALAGSVNSFLAAIPHVTARIPAAVIDLGAWISGEVSKIRAAESLAKAVRVAHELLLSLAVLLEADLKAVSSRINISALAAQTAINHRYGDLPAAHEGLIRRHVKVVASIAQDPAGKEISPAAMQEAGHLADLIKQSEIRYAAYWAEYDGATRRGEQEKGIIANANTAIAAWVKAHGEVCMALEEKRMPAVSTLTNKAIELKGLLENLKGEKK